MTANRIRYFLSYWFPVLAYCGLIYFQSSRPSPQNLPEIPYLDKLLHVGAYALLGVLFMRALRTSALGNKPAALMVLSILLAALYGVSDEIHQYFVPFRTAELLDVLADFLGSLLGVLFYRKTAAAPGPAGVNFPN